MKRLRPFSLALVASATLAWTLPVYATGDCNNGKAIYFKKAGSGATISVQLPCHVDPTQNSKNIQNGSGNPSQSVMR
jgi:hypothetical protein